MDLNLPEKRVFIGPASKFGSMYRNNGLKLKILLNESSRKYIMDQEKAIGVKNEKRFLKTISPVEICIVKHMISLVMLKKEPIVIVVRDTQTANAFKEYFQELWKIAKK